MTKYTYENGEIMKENLEVGWLSRQINHQFLCMFTVKTLLESKGHSFEVNLFMKQFEYIVPDAYLRTTEQGIYITGKEDELNHAFFSNEMNSTKSCAKAVLEVMSA